MAPSVSNRPGTMHARNRGPGDGYDIMRFRGTRGTQKHESLLSAPLPGSMSRLLTPDRF